MSNDLTRRGWAIVYTAEDRAEAGAMMVRLARLITNAGLAPAWGVHLERGPGVWRCVVQRNDTETDDTTPTPATETDDAPEHGTAAMF